MTVVNIFHKDCKFVCKNCGHLYEQRVNMLEKQVLIDCPLCGQADVITIYKNK